MPVLSNAKHERFAHGLAKGETADAAYLAAGYVENRKNASRLKSNEDIGARVAELLGRAAERVEVTVASLTGRLLAIAKKGEESDEAAMLSVGRAAIMDAAKLNGLIVDKKQHELDLSSLTDEQISALALALGSPAIPSGGPDRDREASTTH